MLVLILELARFRNAKFVGSTPIIATFIPATKLRQANVFIQLALMPVLSQGLHWAAYWLVLWGRARDLLSTRWYSLFPLLFITASE